MYVNYKSVIRALFKYFCSYRGRELLNFNERPKRLIVGLVYRSLNFIKNLKCRSIIQSNLNRNEHTPAFCILTNCHRLNCSQPFFDSAFSIGLFQNVKANVENRDFSLLESVKLLQVLHSLSIFLYALYLRTKQSR